jgi:FeS assembly SUF system regulator
MLRISRLTDYAFILLTELAGEGNEQVLSGSTLAERTPLPLPTVRKVLKQLGQEGLLESRQGAHGGYALAKPADELAVSEVIDAMEGPVSVTMCCDDEETCEIEHECPTSDGWKIVNAAIRSTLRNLTLTDIQQGPASEKLLAAARSGPGEPQAPTAGGREPVDDSGPARRSEP